MLPGVLTIDYLRTLYARHPRAICDVIEEVLARIRSARDPAVFISLVDPAELRRRATSLLQEAPDPAVLPLWGIPFAVKGYLASNMLFSFKGSNYPFKG